MIFYVLAMTGLVVATVTFGAQRKLTVAVLVLALSSFAFGTAGLATQAGASENSTACAAAGVGVGLAWVGVGATGVVSEAHGGILTALAAGQAGAATAGWAATCPNLAHQLLGMGHRWIWHEHGCMTVRISRMHNMPITTCWALRHYADWVTIMHARYAQIAVAMYTGRW